jgi:carboxypeptidase Taq
MVFMPKNAKSSMERGAQLSALAGVIHEQSTDPELFNLMQQASQDLEGLDAQNNMYKDEAKVLELEMKAYKENVCIPSALASKQASLGATAQQSWATAREANDFTQFEDMLGECFDTAKEIAEAKRTGLKNDHMSLYTQMLDAFETGMSKDRIDEVFAEVPNALRPLIAKVAASSNQPNVESLSRAISVEKQQAVAQKIVTAIGYNAENGRIDVSVHPFTSSSSRSDVRITSRFDATKDWHMGLIATIHEGGHAIYEQNCGPSPLSLDSHLSMGAHESQSLFWERHVGKSKAFWKWATPIVNEGYSSSGGANGVDTDEEFNYTPQELYAAVNRVEPSFIRVEADELTYPLHVILRYNIERDIVDGSLEVKDIPEKWNAMLKEFIGVDVPSDKLGCLQDVHWSAMAIGYFPTYLIGSLTAAQLAHYCHQDIPDMYELIEKGDFLPLREWLTKKVHRHGKRYSSLDELLEAQVGEKLNPQYFIDYVTKKYTDLYQLE